MIDRRSPDTAADERTTLTQFLDYFRATLALKIDGLTDDQARSPAIEPSDLNLLGLVRHMADVERGWFRRQLADEQVPPLFYGPAHPDGDEDGDMHPGPQDTVADAMAAWQAEIEVARRLERATPSLDDLSARRPSGHDHDHRQPSLRWILVHMIEEYARHCGHADLLRERIDGSTGD